MKEKEVRDSILNKAKEIFNETGFLEVIQVVEDSSAIDYEKVGVAFFRPDFGIRVRLASGKNVEIMFEIMTNAQPRFARTAALRINEICNAIRDSYCVLGAPYLSEASMKICREYGIGYLDLAGNSLFNFENVFINTQGQPNPYTSTRPLRNLFSPKSTRVLRVLLRNPKKEWYVKDMAEEAGVSLGQASNVKKHLLDYEYAGEVQGPKQKKFHLINPEKLLKDWAKNYSYKENELSNYYSLEDPREIEQRIISFSVNTRVRCALTLTSADARLTHFLRGAARSFIYIEKPLEPAASYLGLKEVDSGENITLMVPYDEGVFYGVQEVDNLNVVSDIQLYLDLRSYKQRGKDAAQFLLDRRIKKEWQT